MQHSIIEYCSDHEGYKCGYCKKPDSNYSHGLWAHQLSVYDYQDLIDRGWRRSGKYCYKPRLDIICCPMYTIRCRALELKLSKSQKKVLKRFNKFVLEDNNILNQSNSGDMIVDESEGREYFVKPNRNLQNVDLLNVDLPFIDQEGISNIKKTPKKIIDVRNDSHQSSTAMQNQRRDAGPDPNKTPCKKAKIMRRERKLEKLREKGIDVNTLPTTTRNKQKQIEDFTNVLSKDLLSKLRIRLVRTEPPSIEWLATAKETHEVYVKYQTTIHGDTPSKCTESKFKEFLVDSPLMAVVADFDESYGYGSFHQQYWLGNKLMAVGVIDILPKCVSSVYFFYDPAYTNLTLGTYGALQEIAFTRHLNTLFPDIKYYYMGFYIHSCTKMRYKGNYSPSDLLCPETYNWFPIKDCISKLEHAKYTRFNPNIDSVDRNYPTENDIDNIPIYCNGQVELYKVYKKKNGRKKNELKEEFLEYSRLVGVQLAKSLVVVR